MSDKDNMAYTRSEVFAPASMGNFGVVFDVVGVAFQEPGDILCAEFDDDANNGLYDQSRAIITRIEGDNGRLPTDPLKNTASIAANSTLKLIGAEQHVKLTLYKKLPLASGMGSSAASAVAGALAVNALFGEPLSRVELLPACLDGEMAVSGFHPDNVGPSLLGGITLITGEMLDEIAQLPVPDHLHFALVTPDAAIPTSEARALLPKSISLKNMVAQTGAVARLIDALYRGDLEAMTAAMENDVVIEPARARLIPMLHEARATAKRSGALGLVISGAGPTLCAICDSSDAAQKVAAALGVMYEDADIDSLTRATQVSTEGAKVLSVE
ncbi:MAG: homoserine kinase [Anaerolineae bacterium]|nr:homoserine kinase [Anaerolineae bacterium]